jgi:hypothetical protein
MIASIFDRVLHDRSPAKVIRLRRLTNVAARAIRWEELRVRPGEWHRKLEGDDIVHLPLDTFDESLIEVSSTNASVLDRSRRTATVTRISGTVLAGLLPTRHHGAARTVDRLCG